MTEVQSPRQAKRVGTLNLGLVQFLLTALACALAPLILGRSDVYSGIGLLSPVLFTLLFFGAEIVLGMPRWSTRTDKARGFVSVIVAAAAASVAAFVIQVFLPSELQSSAGVIFISALGVVVFLTACLLLFAPSIEVRSAPSEHAVPTLVVGSGNAAVSLIQVIEDNPRFAFSVVGCVDDQALAERVAGKPIVGRVDDLPKLIAKHEVGCVIITIPSASSELVKRVMSLCVKTTGRDGKSPAVKILPGVLELLNDNVKVSRIRSVQPEDLLPRDPVKVDLATVAPHLENRVILVTGAGGSIGSELCRQIAGLNPKLLLLLGHGENSLFAIEEELRLKYEFERTRIILADVADSARIRNVFSTYRPHVVFHAAAHKHVPIVESNVCEAVRNNILGTHVVALAAAAAGAAKFVLLSTDKAVNPTSVMGATKRLSEIISQSFMNQTSTEFVTVRFGNVLESRGSVIPTFKRQIENGGPVTITHRDMQRYFMTIPEAVSLVLEAMAIGRDGQVLVLDMGKPVNILGLAETLITLSGLTPYRDISIVETGIRPGEKLFEEILTSHEGMSTTSHERLFIAQQERIEYNRLALGLNTLENAVRTGEQKVIVDVLKEFVPTYQPGQHFIDEPGIPTDAKRSSLEMPVEQRSNGRAASMRNGHPLAPVRDTQTDVDEAAVFDDDSGRDIKSQPASAVGS
ncbi:MAG: polysaccharide biosynthesis protein [Candidatus Eremiobacter antarcticus]|nr:polysaccharide biosynthesis protein [Candidatus Eremiobacteraeota bacterium]MBC5808419.1 polysaccharide biosynthesis protein [Candidatus Eremiobacteraeota bacterium]PZR63778.1 MAG: polysaccharide biosynthesis protein [Candidatus Eremiobacter sp. RRmetagenome_bin22]